MNVSKLLTAVESRGIRVALADSGVDLDVRAPAPLLTPKTLTLLVARRPELLEAVRARDHHAVVWRREAMRAVITEVNARPIGNRLLPLLAVPPRDTPSPTARASACVSCNEPVGTAVMARCAACIAAVTELLPEMSAPWPTPPSAGPCRVCGTSTDRFGACWQCNDRPCKRCSTATGSALRAWCRPCANTWRQD